MNLRDLKRGASQTEYILIIVLIAISTMFAVGKYGKEVRTLFKKTNVKLSLMDGNGNVNGDTNSWEGSDVSGGDEDNFDNGGEVINPGDNSDGTLMDNLPERDDNKKDREQCQREYQRLIYEKNAEESQYRQRVSYYNRMINFYRSRGRHFLSLASRSSGWWHWGGWGFGFSRHRSSNYSYYIKMARNYFGLADRMNKSLNRERKRHNAFLENWNLKMSKWQRECGAP